MTTLAAQPVPNLQPILAPSRELRRFTTDSLITANRAATPQAALDQRQVPRLSIAELNEMDMDSIRDSLQRSRSDSRTGIEKFLDIIDLPRNALFNLGAAAVAPGLRAKAKAEGDVGAFGLPRVFASDVLEAAGVENRIVRGVFGFVGDVALDPLTYLGPAGFGIKQGAVGIGVSGKRALKGGLKDFRAGGINAVRQPEVRGIFEAIAAEGGEEFAKSSVEKQVAQLSKRAFGETARKSLGGTAFERALRVIGADQLKGGGIISEGLEKLARVSGEGADLAFSQADRLAAQASGDFVTRFGKAGQGIRLGKNAGSTIAHIPFTQVGIHVPAFTSTGANAALDRAMALARGGSTNGAAVYLNAVGHIENVNAAANLMRDTAEQISSARAAGLDVTGLRNTMDAQVEQADVAYSQLQAALPQERLRAFSEAGDLGDLIYLAAIRRAADASHNHVRATKRFVDILGDQSEYQRRLDQFKQFPGRGDIAADDIAPIINREGDLTEAELRFVDDLNDFERTRMFLAEDDVAAMELMQEIVSGTIKTAADLSEASRSTLKLSLSSDEWIMVKAAQRFADLGSEQAGASVLQSMADVTRRHLGDDSSVADILQKADRRLRTVFGRRSGKVNELRSIEAHRVRAGALVAGNAKAKQLTEAVADILHDAGMKDVGLDESLSLITAMALRNADEGDRVYWANKFNTNIDIKEPTAFLQKIHQAKTKGILADPVVAQRMNDLANEVPEIFEDLGRMAIEDLLLSRTFRDYIPLALTEQGSKVAGRSADPRVVGSGLSKTEGFQKPKHTFEYRYQLEDGTQERLFEYEIDLYRSLSDEDIRLMGLDNPRAAELAIEAKNRVNRFETVAKAELGDAVNLDSEDMLDVVRATYARQADPFTLNELAESGAFSYLQGNSVEGALFETNIAVLALKRSAAQGRVAARESFLREIAGRFAIRAPAVRGPEGAVSAPFEKLIPGSKVEINGVGGVVIEDARFPGERGIRVGPQVYRRLKGDIISKSQVPILNDLDDTEHLMAMWPDEVAEQIERFSTAFDPRNVNVIMEALERTTSLWKATTLMHPSWIAVNLIGNVVLAQMAGANLVNVAKFLPKASQAVRGLKDPNVIRGKTVMLRGVETSLDEISASIADGVANMSRSHINEMELTRRGVIEPSLSRAVAEGAIPVGSQRSTGRRIKDSFISAVADTAEAGRALRSGEFKPAAGRISDRASRTVIQPWFRANAHLEDTMRTAVFMSFVDEGMDAESAIEATIRGLFNYQDFTTTEQTIRRHLIPFYSWIRNNAPYQIEQLFRQPKYAAAVPKIRDALEQSINGEANLPLNQRPRWLRDQLAMQIGREPESRYGLTLSSLLPQQEAYRAGASATLLAEGSVGEAAQEFLRGLASSFNPVIKTPLEIGAGKEFFTQRSIGPDEFSGDLTVGEAVTGQFRPFREFGIGSRREGPVQRSFGRGVGPGVGRSLLGGRVQPLDPERIRFNLLREFQARERGIRRAIALTRREGGDEASEPQRLELLKLYRQMLEAGLDEDVPRWAREQLGAL